MTEPASRFAAELRRLRVERGLSYRALAELAKHGKSYLEDLEKGRKPPNPAVAGNLDKVLGTGGRLACILRLPADHDADAELEALELARRIAASDVSGETLDHPGDGAVGTRVGAPGRPQTHRRGPCPR